MKNKAYILLLISFVIVALGASSVFAGHRSRKNARKRQHHEETRIREGVRSGELTKDEAKGLQNEQRNIRRERAEAMKDGKMTKDEAKEIQKDQNEASEHIYEEKHDGEKQPEAQ